MREIKFRAWDDYNKVMISPYCELKDNHFWGEDLTNTGYETPIAVMQFTGLHDRNGKEVYEGDIVSITINKGFPSEYTGNWEIYFGSWCYMRKHPIWSSFSFDVALANNCEVIGNIYENPELLNQKA